MRNFEQADLSNTYLAVKEEKSSWIMLEAESLDWMAFSASSPTFLIPSFSMRKCWKQYVNGKYPLPLPKNTPSEGNTAAAAVLQHPAQIHYHESKPEGAKNPSRSCRHRKGEISTYKYISHLSHTRSDLAYVFHAPDITIATSRLSGVAASVWYLLSRTLGALHLGKFISNARTVSSCHCGNLLEASRANFRNHRLVHPPGIRLGGLSPPFLRSYVRIGWMGRGPPTHVS